jgi:hypothetical protein
MRARAVVLPPPETGTPESFAGTTSEGEHNRANRKADKKSYRNFAERGCQRRMWNDRERCLPVWNSRRFAGVRLHDVILVANENAPPGRQRAQQKRAARAARSEKSYCGPNLRCQLAAAVGRA